MFFHTIIAQNTDTLVETVSIIEHLQKHNPSYFTGVPLVTHQAFVYGYFQIFRHLKTMQAKIVLKVWLPCIQKANRCSFRMGYRLTLTQFNFSLLLQSPTSQVSCEEIGSLSKLGRRRKREEPVKKVVSAFLMSSSLCLFLKLLKFVPFLPKFYWFHRLLLRRTTVVIFKNVVHVLTTA